MGTSRAWARSSPAVACGAPGCTTNRATTSATHPAATSCHPRGRRRATHAAPHSSGSTSAVSFAISASAKNTRCAAPAPLQQHQRRRQRRHCEQGVVAPGDPRHRRYESRVHREHERRRQRHAAARARGGASGPAAGRSRRRGSSTLVAWKPCGASRRSTGRRGRTTPSPAAASRRATGSTTCRYDRPKTRSRFAGSARNARSPTTRSRSSRPVKSKATVRRGPASATTPSTTRPRPGS